MAHYSLLACLAIILSVGSAAWSAEAPVTPPEVFIQQHHEHSPLTYSSPISLEDGTHIRYGVDRHHH